MGFSPHYSYINDQPPQQPPPPYTAPYEFTRRDLSSLHTSPFGMSQCPLHRSQPCACLPVQCKVEVTFKKTKPTASLSCYLFYSENVT